MHEASERGWHTPRVACYYTVSQLGPKPRFGRASVLAKVTQVRRSKLGHKLPRPVLLAPWGCGGKR